MCECTFRSSRQESKCLRFLRFGQNNLKSYDLTTRILTIPESHHYLHTVQVNAIFLRLKKPTGKSLPAPATTRTDLSAKCFLFELLILLATCRALVKQVHRLLQLVVHEGQYC
jgi:hypothetical protein